MFLVTVTFWSLLFCLVRISGSSSSDPWALPNGLVASHHPNKLFQQPSSSSRVAGLCSDPRCACSVSNNNSQVSCHCSPQDQEVTLAVHPFSVPHNVSILVIKGCRHVFFYEGGLKHLTKLASLTVVDVGEVVFESGSFHQAQVEHDTTVTVGRCRQLIIKSGAFISHPLKPVTFHSTQCISVRLNESAFNRLHRLALDHIQGLELASHTFRFASSGSGGSAGTVRADIALRHVVMTDLRNFTFPSPLNRLSLENVTIQGRIETNATSALSIVQFSISNCVIGRISTGALSALTHLDSLTLSSTQVDVIESGAFASAASSLIIEDCYIGLMNHSALSMPAARVILRANTIKVLASGGLHLREWNELLIENNTVFSVERHAFYQIGEPKHHHHIDQSPNDVRFIIRRNVFHRVESGAFIISAQALKLQLEANQFIQLCDCQMSSWTADLTQVSRRTEAAIPSPDSLNLEWREEVMPDALWLGTSLFNTSSCWMDEAIAVCAVLAVFPSSSSSSFIPMSNYTDLFCASQNEPQFAQCLATQRSMRSAIQQNNKELIGSSVDDRVGTVRTVGRSDQDILLVVIFAILAALVLLAVFMGLILIRRRRTKSRQPSGLSNSKVCEDRLTSSPLIPEADKQLGGGMVSSGSISCLSVKEYRNYLDELGPIYSEPLDPPTSTSNLLTGGIQLPLLAPPEVPAIPAEWNPKSSYCTVAIGKESIERGKSTIDRGTQTFTESSTTIEDAVVGNLCSSLAQEFSNDVLAALNDKLDVSPTYSEVKDSIKPLPTSEENVAKDSAVLSKRGEETTSHLTAQELYDLIRVVDSSAQPRPSTSSAGSDHIYCRPWSIRDSDPLTGPLLSPGTADDQKMLLAVSVEPTQPTAAAPGVDPSKQEKGAAYSIVELPKSSKSVDQNVEKTQVSEKKKPQPFHIRGSLPKWPPPSRESPISNRTPRRTSSASSSKSHSSSPTVSPPTSPTKDTKPPWRSTVASKPTASRRPTSPRVGVISTSGINPNKASLSPKGDQLPCTIMTPDISQATLKVMSTTDDPSSSLGSEKSSSNKCNTDLEVMGDEYSEVITAPFSFSFRKPLFNKSLLSYPEINEGAPSNIDDSPGPPKPARIPSPTLCDYADPRDQDVTEPVYSELLTHEDNENRQPLN